MGCYQSEGDSVSESDTSISSRTGKKASSIADNQAIFESHTSEWKIHSGTAERKAEFRTTILGRKIAVQRQKEDTMSMNRGGDSLARGASSYTFRASESGTPQAKWNLAFGVNDKDAGVSKKRKKKSKR
jgi:hypothetical protein